MGTIKTVDFVLISSNRKRPLVVEASVEDVSSSLMICDEFVWPFIFLILFHFISHLPPPSLSLFSFFFFSFLRPVPSGTQTISAEDAHIPSSDRLSSSYFLRHKTDPFSRGSVSIFYHRRRKIKHPRWRLRYLYIPYGTY